MQLSFLETLRVWWGRNLSTLMGDSPSSERRGRSDTFSYLQHKPPHNSSTDPSEGCTFDARTRRILGVSTSSYTSSPPTERTKANQHQKRVNKHTRSPFQMLNYSADFHLLRSTRVKSFRADCKHQAVLITSAISSSLATPKMFCKYCCILLFR